MIPVAFKTSSVLLIPPSFLLYCLPCSSLTKALPHFSLCITCILIFPLECLLPPWSFFIFLGSIVGGVEATPQTVEAVTVASVYSLEVLLLKITHTLETGSDLGGNLPLRASFTVLEGGLQTTKGEKQSVVLPSCNV